MVDVEIIPFYHFAGYRAYDDCIAYIKKLPRNSSLAVEMTSTQIEFLQSCLFQPEFDRKSITTLSLPEVRAAAEVVFICHQRGIHLLPLETTVSSVKGIKGEIPISYLVGEDQTGTLIRRTEKAMVRDKTFAKNMGNIVEANTSKIPALVGMAHCPNFMVELNALGISSAFRLDIFGEKNVGFAIRAMDYLCTAIRRRNKRMKDETAKVAIIILSRFQKSEADHDIWSMAEKRLQYRRGKWNKRKSMLKTRRQKRR